MEAFSRAPERAEVGDVIEETIDVAGGAYVDCVEGDEVGGGAVCGDFEDAEAGLVDVGFADDPVVEGGEHGECGLHDLGGLCTSCFGVIGSAD